MKVKDGKIVFTKKEAKAALKTLTEAKKLFKNGKRWIKGEEKSYVKLAGDREEPTFCMIGAIREADGPGEHLAAISLMAAIAPWTESELGVDEDYQLRDPGYIVSDQEDIITSYNDKKATKYKDISLKMQKAATLLRRGYLPVKKD